jgi:hypothetical protein
MTEQTNGKDNRGTEIKYRNYRTCVYTTSYSVRTDVSEKPAASVITTLHERLQVSTLMMKTSGFSETSVHIYLEDDYIYSYGFENLKSH